jgi:hypothetical protein
MARAGLPAPLRTASPATLLFAAALIVSGTVLMNWLSRLTFWRDDWLVLHRREWSVDTFFDPFVEQLLALPIFLYKVLIELFGMDSAFPIQLMATLLFLGRVAVMFAYARRRVGDWLALAAALPILFFGASWTDLLVPFQHSFYGSMLFGTAAFLALERHDRRGDVLAAASLTIALLWCDLGIPFVVGATVWIAYGADRFRRAWVVAIPTAVFGLWYLGWGHEAQTFISFHNFANLPSYVPEGFASSISSYLGLGSPGGSLESDPLAWGRPLLVVAIALVIWRLAQLRTVPGPLAAVFTAGFVFWCLAGLNTSVFSPPTAGRYQYIGAFFVVLIAAELIRGVRFRRVATIGVFVAIAAATLSNLSLLREAVPGLEGIADKQRAGLAALELSRDTVDPDLLLTEENSDVDYINLLVAGLYLDAVDDYGSPAFTPTELAEAPEEARIATDKVFAAAHELELVPVPTPRGTGCVESGGRGAPAVGEVPVGATVLVPQSDAEVGLRRYASEGFPVELGALEPGTAYRLEIPADRSNEPWELEVTASRPIAICAGRAG